MRLSRLFGCCGTAKEEDDDDEVYDMDDDDDEPPAVEAVPADDAHVEAPAQPAADALEPWLEAAGGLEFLPAFTTAVRPPLSTLSTFHSQPSLVNALLVDQSVEASMLPFVPSLVAL